MKLPGPDHPITICRKRQARARHVRRPRDRRHHAALTLKEASYKPVLYIPRADADMSLLKPPTTTRIVPIKATQAISRSLPMAARAENAVWSYEQPFPAMAEIKELSGVLSGPRGRDRGRALSAA